MTTFNHITFSAALITLFFSNTLPLVNADYLTNRGSNMSFDSLQMYQSTDTPAVSPYMLFDALARQYGIASYGDGSETYNAAASQNFYDERGVKQFYNTWHVDNGGQIIGSFGSHAGENTIRMNDTAGNSLWSHTYPTDYHNVSDWVNSFNAVPLDVLGGDYVFTLDNGYGNTLSGNELNYWNAPWSYEEGYINLITFDVTDLVRAMGYEADSAYMFAWEDLPGNIANFDYNDLVYIVTNVKNADTPAPGAVTPEPATLALFGIGLAGLAPLRRREQR